MATTATPLPSGQRPNVATAAVRFPAVKDYEQVDREIGGTLGPSPRLVRGARHRDPLHADRRDNVDIPDS
jgi:hypothetical protein